MQTVFNAVAVLLLPCFFSPDSWKVDRPSTSAFVSYSMSAPVSLVENVLQLQLCREIIVHASCCSGQLCASVRYVFMPFSNHTLLTPLYYRSSHSGDIGISGQKEILCTQEILQNTSIVLSHGDITCKIFPD